jgi:hypothetical protein
MTSLLYSLGLENQRLHVSVIEIDEFPRLAEAMRLRALPTMVIGDRTRLVGLLEPGILIEQLALASSGRATIGDGLLGAPSGPSTPVGAAPEPRTSPSGLILPGR